MLDRFRHNEGADQLDLFPEATRPKYVAWVVGGILLVLLLCLVKAMAGEPIILTQALICDTEDQVKDQLDIMTSATNARVDPTMVEGCGSLIYAVPAIITPTSVYENKYIRAQLAKIEIPDMAVQYGYIAVEYKDQGDSI